jgi:hypothetical protein
LANPKLLAVPGVVPERTEPPEIDIAEPKGDLVVLPREIDDEGNGLYDDSAVTVVKELKAFGVEASYQHDPDHRTWIGEKSVEIVVLNLITGIASNAGWAALCKLVGRQHNTERVRLRVGRLRKSASGIAWDWYKLEGSGKDVATALAAMEEAGLTELDDEEAKAHESSEKAGPPRQ